MTCTAPASTAGAFCMSSGAANLHGCGLTSTPSKSSVSAAVLLDNDVDIDHNDGHGATCAEPQSLPGPLEKHKTRAQHTAYISLVEHAHWH
eukprot:SM000044S15987  [mRNA]  locus=s44:459848:460120:+ [translate_table: standard]